MGAVRDFVEDCVETVKYIAEEVRDTISDIFGGSGGGGISGSSGGDTDEHKIKIANELAEKKEKMGKFSREYEERIMDYLNLSMDDFLKAVESLNNQKFDGESLSINVEAIKEKNERLKSQVIGCLGNVMNTRLVQTDKELGVILEERDDKKRNKQFDVFVEKVQRQAIDKFKKKIEKTAKEQSEVISTEIKARQKEVDARLEESVKEFHEIMETKKRNDAGLAKKQLGFMYESDLCDFVLREVEAL